MLHILALFSVLCGFCLLLKQKFEQALPMILLNAMLMLTLLAMFEKLLWVDALAFGTIIGCLLIFLYSLLSKRITLPEISQRLAARLLTPGFVCFGLLLCFFLYATEPMVAWWRDDIEYWAFMPKSLWLFNGLVDGSRHLIPRFATYTPGVQVLQWWMMHVLGEWRESSLYFILFMTYGIFLLPFCTNIRWKQAWLIPFVTAAIILLPAWGNAVSYTFLGVDTTLSLCFGYTLIQIWRSRNGDPVSLYSAALGLCGLVLIKQAGFLLACFAIALIFLTRKPQKKDFLCALSPVLAWGVWMLFCNLQGLTGFHTSDMSLHIASMLSGTYIPPEGAEGLGEALWYALTTPDLSKHTFYSGYLRFETAPLLLIPKVLWLALLMLAPWLFAKCKPSPALKRISLFFFGITTGYLLVQFFGFLTVFYGETPVYVHQQKWNMLLLMERYLAPIQLGMTLFVLWLITENYSPPPRKKSQKTPNFLPALVACASLLGLLLTTNLGVLTQNLLPDHYIQQDLALGIEGEILMDHDWGFALEEYENARVLIGLEPSSDYVRNFRYTFAPTQFHLPLHVFKNDPAALAAYLLENNITHLIYFDDLCVFHESAATFAEEGDFYSWVLYETFSDDDGLRLEEFI